MNTKETLLSSLKNTKPKGTALSASSIDIRKEFIENEHGKIRVFRNTRPGNQLQAWIDENLQEVNSAYGEFKAVLFRGFEVGGKFHTIARSMADSDLLDYKEPSTPRTQVNNNIYTSTEYPKDQHIPLHNEHSYTDNWPRKIWFTCEIPAEKGGQTPVCDSESMYKALPAGIRDKFERLGVMYVRNFGKDMDLKWEEVYGTSDKKEVDDFCHKKGIKTIWKEDGTLRTEQVCQGILTHPESGKKLWFNQAHLFHYSNLPEYVRKFLVDRYGEDNLPRHAYFGDGSAIEPETLDAIRMTFEQVRIVFDWEKDDVLLLDNMQFAHARFPFEGQRRVLVCMAEPFHHTFIPERLASQAEGQQAVNQTRRQTADHFIRNIKTDTRGWLKYKLAAAYRIMVAENLDEGGISGHISLKVPGERDYFWVNPFGKLAEEVTPDNLVMVDRSGNIVEGNPPINTAGFCIHAAIHGAYPEIHAVAHTHSPWGTVFGSYGKPLLPIDQNCCMFYENHAVYDSFNGPVNDSEDANRIAETIAGKSAIILRNHGTITCGTNVETAVMYMVAMERAYRLNALASQYGEPKLIVPNVARETKMWIANPLGFRIEFDALLRKAERMFPDLHQFRPSN